MKRFLEVICSAFVGLPVLALYHWLSTMLGDWIIRSYFTLSWKDGSSAVSPPGHAVFVASRILPFLLWISSVRDMIMPKPMDGESDTNAAEKSGEEKQKIDQRPVSDSTSYIPKRTLEMVAIGLGTMLWSSVIGRSIAFLTGRPFLPATGEYIGVGVMCLPYCFVLVKSAWGWANNEVTSARRGDPVNHDLALLIHCTVPFVLIFTLGSFAAQSGTKDTRTGGTVLLVLFLVYLGYEKIAGPITNWWSDQKMMDRNFGKPSPSTGNRPEQGSELQEQPDRRE